ncbi:NAD(P)H-binding protein [Amycolatopsis sp. CA-230715]|uniref:NAD(P)H-binding protein n=1 Tax=Amycolatopsis sp. CA-230715 TaxID=2745196 RepID=UPI001C01C0BC|nr:NAD(P)H-binding protein [Amycolatopsis sp. CA-230715]QWF84173.1 NAD(P)H azoreductase [Amycolatopsis sp. CA-230715]
MILVTGATGSVGRHVVADLLAAGHQVRAMTRNPSRASIPPGAEIVAGDLADPASVPFDGVHAVYLMAMGNEPDQVVAQAVRNGVRRIVLLSTGDVLDDVAQQPDAIAKIHGAFEHAVATSDLEWTFLRPNEFAGNSLHWAPQIQAGNVVQAPFAQARTAPIHERDIAAVAARALTENGHHGQKYALTGPEAITHADQVDQIGTALGRRLRFDEISAAEAAARMSRFAPTEIVEAVLGQLAAAVGHQPVLTDTVHAVTGQKSRSFADWARDHVADFQ